MRDNLFRMRTTWVDGLAARVCRQLGPDLRRSGMLPSWVADDQLTLAAMLCRIAVEDIRGSAPQAICDHLRSTGFVISAAPVSMVASELVIPVLYRFRRHGAPWDRWWDVRGLHELFVELWAGRRLSTHSPETVRDELQRVWRLPDQLLEVALHNAADPFVSLPPDLLYESATGTASACMGVLVAKGLVKIGSREDLLRARPELTDRPDLASVVQRMHRRTELERMMHRARDLSAELLARLRSDLDAWDAQMRQLLSGLTAYELNLMTPATGDDRYAEQCLVEGGGLHQARLMTDDALLWEPNSVDPEPSVPDWMVEEIVTCGSRFFHTQVGPHPVWMGTAETDVHLATVRELLKPGTRYGFDVEDYGDGLRLWLVFPTPPGDPGPPIRAPYTYSLCWVEHAWELLHLATVGYTRLSVVRLVGDGELKAVGSIWLALPEEACARSKEAAIMALRRLVGDETQTIKQRIAGEGLDQAAEVAFRSCENAKGEDIHEELSLVSDAVEYRHFVDAARGLARARARQASRLLDGEDPQETNTELETAVEERQRTRELLRAAVGRGNGKTSSNSGSGVLPGDEQTVFVHLINRYGRLQLTACWTRAGRSHFDLVSCEQPPLGHLAEVVGEWARHSPDDPGEKWHHYLEQAMARCGELMQSVIEMTAPHGFTRLMLSPAAPLELLPLHAAPIDAAHGVTLNDAFAQVVYAPTARLAAALQQSERHAAAVDVLVVAHGGGHIPNLPSIIGPRYEADLIAALHDSSEVLRHEEATPARALHAMSRARIVHVAAHGLTHPNRWAAGLALQGSSLGEATLTISRILADGAFSSVDLVVLNACRTGTHEGTGRSVQTLRSLESAFLARGAKAVVSTLWEITDLVGVVFSAVLHAHLSAGMHTQAAYADTIHYLRAQQWRVPSQEGPLISAESAVSSVLADWRTYLDQQVAENPLFWAAFKITGTVC